MITNNLKKIMFSIIAGSSVTGYRETELRATLVDTSGANVSYVGRTMNNTGMNAARPFGALINSLNNMATNSGTLGTTFVKVGTGTTEPTESDYTLEVENAEVTCSVAACATSGNITKVYTATFSNPTENDVVIAEIGLFGCFSTYANNTGDIPLNFLLDRTVLDTPITIPAGESKAITYEIGF